MNAIKAQKLVRRFALVGLCLLPAIVFLAVQHRLRADRQAMRRRAVVQRKEWNTRIMEASVTRHGLVIGRPFPRLPASPPGQQEAAIKEGRPTVVLMIQTLPSEPNYEVLREWARALEPAPSVHLFVLTEDSQREFARHARQFSNPRMHYARVPKPFMDRIGVYGTPTAFSVAPSGVLVSWESLDYTASSGSLGPVLARAQQKFGGPT